MTAPAEGGSAEIERDARFSESVLWTIQRRYYEKQGPAAWHSGEVPHYATCNTFIARSYALAALAYLRDARTAGQIDPAHPVYIVEIAAGVGRFAFQFLRAWRALKAESSVADLDIRYVMTDFNSTNPGVWAKHPYLAPFVADKLLAFGLFDIERSRSIQLLAGGELSAATVKNPMVVLGNYAFDTFAADLVKLEGGKAQEVRVSLRAPAGSDPAAPKTSKLHFQFTDHPIEGTYYDDPALERVLARYRETLSGTLISIPVGGARGLRTLLEMSKDRMLLITSDKGFVLEDELYARQQHALQFHGDTAFSMMVNFHAIGRYLEERGGWWLGTSRRSMSLRTLVGIVGADAPAFGATKVHLKELMEFGPGEFFDYYQTIRKSPPKTLNECLSLLRLSGYDPQMVCDFAANLREITPGLDELAQLELRVALDRAWRNYYPGPVNMPFELARILMVMRRPVEAARFYEISLEWFGETPATRFNLGICHYYAERPVDAMASFRRVLELAPDFSGAPEWISRLKTELDLGLGAPTRVTAPTAPPPNEGDTAKIGGNGDPPRERPRSDLRSIGQREEGRP